MTSKRQRAENVSAITAPHACGDSKAWGDLPEAPLAPRNYRGVWFVEYPGGRFTVSSPDGPRSLESPGLVAQREEC
jgi:hypothetical protein